MLCRFFSGNKMIFKKSIEYGKGNVYKTIEKLKKKKFEFSGTEIYKPMKHLLDWKEDDRFLEYSLL